MNFYASFAHSVFFAILASNDVRAGAGRTCKQSDRTPSSGPEPRTLFNWFELSDLWTVRDILLLECVCARFFPFVYLFVFSLSLFFSPSVSFTSVVLRSLFAMWFFFGFWFLLSGCHREHHICTRYASTEQTEHTKLFSSACGDRSEGQGEHLNLDSWGRKIKLKSESRRQVVCPPRRSEKYRAQFGDERTEPNLTNKYNKERKDSYGKQPQREEPGGKDWLVKIRLTCQNEIHDAKQNPRGQGLARV